MRYPVAIEQTSTNYSAYAPDVPGCAAVGDTIEEVTKQIQEALAFHFEGLLEDRESIPKPSTQVGWNDVPLMAAKVVWVEVPVVTTS